MEQALILGRYRPLAELGEGGHGAVTLAFDTKMARRVAIKRIPLSHAGVRNLARTTGLAEARTAAMLNHPDIVTVHEWDTDSDEAFLIMEHLDGVSLATILDTYAPLDPDEAAAVLAHVCAAMTFAHDNGVLHLDLKPENVLVARDGRVKVADFGVAALTNASGQAISAGGTLGYMPPEQLHGGVVDTRTDVWALGALAYETLTGAVPFASDSFEGALYRVEYVTPPAPSEFAAELPAAFDEVVLACLSTDPEERYPSIRELSDDLLPLLGDEERGRAGLAELVAGLVSEEEPDTDEGLSGLGLWDRLLRPEPALRRAAAAIACGWLAWSGLSTLGVGQAPAIGGSAIASAAAALAPPAGLAAGLIVFAAGVFTRGPLAGLLAAALGILWWVWVGRRRGWAGIVPVFAPFFAAASLGPALPLLAGFFMADTWAAAAAGAASGAVTVIASAASGPALALGRELSPLVGPHTLLGVPPTFLGSPLGSGWAFRPPAALPALGIVVGWALASAIMSVAARRATRGAAAGGAVLAALPLLAAVGPWMTGSQRLEPIAAMHVGLSLILVFVVIALGPPVAPESDD